MADRMSFAETVRRELWDIPIKSSCCRKAFLYGLMLRAKFETESGKITLTVPVSRGDSRGDIEIIEGHVRTMLHSQFGCTAVSDTETHGAHRYLRFDFTSAGAADILATLHAAGGDASVSGDMVAEEAVGFGCSSCAAHFLRGVFLCAGSVSDPNRAHHLEFRLPDDGSAVCVTDLCSACGTDPGITHRDGQCGIFFKRLDDISDMLTKIGCVKQVFEIMFRQMFNEKRVDEARATNWEAANIGRTVKAGQRQTAAIRMLAEQHKLERLPSELQETARLRVEHADASLAELAALHNPPITKSGLNHRLSKITRLGEELLKDS